MQTRLHLSVFDVGINRTRGSANTVADAKTRQTEGFQTLLLASPLHLSPMRQTKNGELGNTSCFLFIYLNVEVNRHNHIAYCCFLFNKYVLLLWFSTLVCISYYLYGRVPLDRVRNRVRKRVWDIYGVWPPPSTRDPLTHAWHKATCFCCVHLYFYSQALPSLSGAACGRAAAPRAPSLPRTCAR